MLWGTKYMKSPYSYLPSNILCKIASELVHYEKSHKDMHSLIVLIVNNLLLMKISCAFGFDNSEHIVHDNQLYSITLSIRCWNQDIVEEGHCLEYLQQMSTISRRWHLMKKRRRKKCNQCELVIGLQRVHIVWMILWGSKSFSQK